MTSHRDVLKPIWLALSLALVLTAIRLMPSLTVIRAEAAPIRGNTPWAIILCQFADHPEEPEPPQFFREFMTADGAGMGGMYDYWKDVSYGNIDLTGSVVNGWYTEPYTWGEENVKSRWQKIADCITTAQNDLDNPFTVPNNYHIAVMVNAKIDSGSAGGRVILDPFAWNVTFAAHEMGHSYGLVHSFDTSGASCGGAPGEYCDPYDIMSAMAVYDYNGPNYSTSGPGLNALNLDKLGWLPWNRIYTFGPNGSTTTTITLAALNHLEANGYLMARVPIDPAHPFHYYTVEFRSHTGWDAALPTDTVLLHEVREDGHSYLLRINNESKQGPLQDLEDPAHNISIKVVNIDSASFTATITIGGNPSGYIYGPNTCIQGYVWREADENDYVCVTPQTRAQAAYDNSQADARRYPGGGDYGPDTCIQGYVWREAFPGDHVCVTPQTRAQAAYDNSQAAKRIAQ